MSLQLNHIALELTDRCNLDCCYCYNIWKMPGADHQPFNSYRKAIRALKKIFTLADIRSVTLTGGEPFLAERVMEVALFCRMKGKAVTMISNGTAGKPEQYRQLIDMGVTLFEMPVHSADEAVHDAITGVQGSWQKSVASLKAVRDMGGYPVAVIVLTRHNAPGLSATLDCIAALGIKRIMLNRYNIGGRHTADPKAVSATHAQLREAFRTANEKAAEHALTITSNVCTPICLLDPADYPHLGFGNCSPDPLRKPITLDISGNIRLCNHSPVVAGNIFREPLEEILYSPYARSWSETVPEYCASCKVWERCLGGCRAASEQCGLGLDSPDPVIANN